MSSRNLEIDGVIIHRRSLGDSDRVVEMLTPTHGRVAAVANGGRASRKRFAGALDLFVSLEVQVLVRPTLWTLVAADIVDARVDLRRQLKSIERASVMCECAQVLTPEHQEARACYEALITGLDALARGEISGAVATYPRLLAAAGVMPDLERCCRCGSRGRPVLSTEGSLCVDCAPGRRPLPDDVVAVFRGQPCKDPQLAAAVEDIAMTLVERQSERRLRSRVTVPRWPAATHRREVDRS